MRVRLHQLLLKLNPNRSLRARVGWGTIGTTLLLSFLLSLLAGQFSRSRIVSSRGEFLSSLAFQMADKLDRGMFERYRDIQILASLDDIHQPNVAINKKRALIEKLQSTYPDYAWIGLTDEAGTVVASTGKLLEGKSTAKRPWFQQSRESPFAGDVHEALLLESLLENDTAEPLRFVDVAAPVVDDAGNFEGVLGAHLSWAWAAEVKKSLLAPLEQQQQVEIFILSADDRVLLGPGSFKEEVLTLESLAQGKSDPVSSYLIETWPDQTEYLTGFSPSQGYREFEGLGWTILVRQPAELAFAPARALQQQVFGWGAALGSIFAILSWLNARRIVTAILRLTTTANRIQQGEPNVVIPLLSGQDELSILSGSLNHLVETLDLKQKELATANQQLQSELMDRQRSEHTIREQAALLDIATDAIFVRDLNGIIQYWNQGAEHIYGWSAQEAYGKNALTLLNPAVSDQLKMALKQVIEQGEWQGELPKRTKSDQAITTASRWTLVRDEAQNPRAILTVDTDITEAKQLEAQFLRAQRLESLGTLASGIAHDLNNVLTPILGAAELLPITLKEMDNASARLIKNLDISAQRAGDMVKQILSFARGVEGDRQLVQVLHVLGELRQVISNTFPKNIAIEMNLGSALWPVIADTTQLQQVFTNLCVNARDAMPDGGVLTLAAQNIWIDEHYCKLHADAEIGPYVVVSVLDTGTGMPPEILDRILEPFFTTKEIGKGTGLGLSTTVGIIKNHGGFVMIYSEAGRGSKFQVYLPAQESAIAQGPEEIRPRSGQGEMILVVDDERVIREMTEAALTAHNYRVMTASNGHEAISKYTQHQGEIQVVLMDMMMPALGGAQAIAELTKLDPAIQILATSGLALQKTPLNIHSFLPKPYAIRELLTALEGIIHPTP